MKIRLKIALIIPLLLYSVSLSANITSVTLIPSATDLLSNGQAYYVAGKQYTFRILATEPNSTLRNDWGTITLNFYEGAVLRQTCQVDIKLNGAGAVVGVPTGITVDNGVYISADNSMIEYQVTLRFNWNAVPFNAAVTNRIEAIVTNTTLPAPLTFTRTLTNNYGVIAQIAILNFAQDNDASDGRVNPWHTAFNVTGSIVYFLAGQGITNTVESIDPGEVTTAELFRNGVTTSPGITDSGIAPDIQYSIPADYFRSIGGSDAIPTALGNHTWDVRATMNTGGAVETSTNTMAIQCNKIQITSITFTNGGGINSPYYRSINIPTTEITVQAQLQFGGGAMIGAATLIVSDGINNYTIQILNGSTLGQVLINPLPNLAQVPNTDTQPLTYTVVSAYGSAFDGDGVTGQNSAARIRDIDPLAPHIINWDRDDPPGTNAFPFTVDLAGLNTSTAQSITLNWQNLPNVFPDEDFYTYRIYYKETAVAVWTIVDRTTPDYGLGGAGDPYRLDLITTNSASLTGLIPLSSYDYQISALDVFGNEVLLANRITGSEASSASSIQVSVTDSITNYSDADFNSNPDPTAAIRLRKTSIRVTAEIVTAGNVPDAVFIVLADNSTDVPLSGGKLQYGTGAFDNIMDAGMAALRYEIAFNRVSGNKWQAYIPSDHPLLNVGTTVRFVIRMQFLSGDTFVDHDSEADLVPPGNYQDEEWRFYIYGEPKFTPWPTRILNNVITDKNPVAYPAYYLTDDAYVTITAYDIKGRIVAILLQDAYRKAGQNIKENGWRGTNKSNKKLGLGLYYVHIKAKRASDGKIIIDKFNKVVMAK